MPTERTLANLNYYFSTFRRSYTNLRGAHASRPGVLVLGSAPILCLLYLLYLPGAHYRQPGAPRGDAGPRRPGRGPVHLIILANPNRDLIIPTLTLIRRGPVLLLILTWTTAHPHNNPDPHLGLGEGRYT
eukprot:scaffold132474_cov63-Phaeocystis_antarctica.AAC.1